MTSKNYGQYSQLTSIFVVNLEMVYGEISWKFVIDIVFDVTKRNVIGNRRNL